MWILCACFDRKMDEFIPDTMFPSRTPGAACRTFVDVVRRGGDTQIAKHPEDFFLAQVGAFDETTGEVVGMGDRRFMMLMEALEIRARYPEDDGDAARQLDGQLERVRVDTPQKPED